MNGKIVGSVIVGVALIAGAALYYLQVYYFYDKLAPEAVSLRLTALATGAPEAIPVAAVQAIDADSSPIRFRACFTTPLSLATLSETYRLYEDPVPLTAPSWFGCFDAGAIEEGLKDGSALAFLGQADIKDGADRVIAIFRDGRAYAWQQLNATYSE